MILLVCSNVTIPFSQHVVAEYSRMVSKSSKAPRMRKRTVKIFWFKLIWKYVSRKILSMMRTAPPARMEKRVKVGWSKISGKVLPLKRPVSIQTIAVVKKLCLIKRNIEKENKNVENRFNSWLCFEFDCLYYLWY